MRVLLTDDSKSIRLIMRKYLIDLNVTDMLEASNGRECLEILAANMPVDLIILDWNMPEIDGMEVLKTIRATEQYQSVRVVMCTSDSNREDVILALRAGANNYITKPFDESAVREKILPELHR